MTELTQQRSARREKRRGKVRRAVHARRVVIASATIVVLGGFLLVGCGSEPAAGRVAPVLELTTVDGLSLKVLSAKRDGNLWLRLEASGEGEAAKEADEIIARTGGWTYKISPYAASNIAKRLENLVEDAKPKA